MCFLFVCVYAVCVYDVCVYVCMLYVCGQRTIYQSCFSLISCHQTW